MAHSSAVSYQWMGTSFVSSKATAAATTAAALLMSVILSQHLPQVAGQQAAAGFQQPPDSPSLSQQWNSSEVTGSGSTYNTYNTTGYNGSFSSSSSSPLSDDGPTWNITPPTPPEYMDPANIQSMPSGETIVSGSAATASEAADDDMLIRYIRDLPASPVWTFQPWAPVAPDSVTSGTASAAVTDVTGAVTPGHGAVTPGHGAMTLAPGAGHGGFDLMLVVVDQQDPLLGGAAAAATTATAAPAGSGSVKGSSSNRAYALNGATGSTVWAVDLQLDGDGVAATTATGECDCNEGIHMHYCTAWMHVTSM